VCFCGRGTGTGRFSGDDERWRRGEGLRVGRESMCSRRKTSRSPCCARWMGFAGFLRWRKPAGPLVGGSWVDGDRQVFALGYGLAGFCAVPGGWDSLGSCGGENQPVPFAGSLGLLFDEVSPLPPVSPATGREGDHVLYLRSVRGFLYLPLVDEGGREGGEGGASWKLSADSWRPRGCRFERSRAHG